MVAQISSLLPICYHLFLLLSYSTSDYRVNLGCGISLHSRHDMRIQIERDADSRVAEAFTGNLRMNASGK